MPHFLLAKVSGVGEGPGSSTFENTSHPGLATRPSKVSPATFKNPLLSKSIYFTPLESPTIYPVG